MRRPKRAGRRGRGPAMRSGGAPFLRPYQVTPNCVPSPSRGAISSRSPMTGSTSAPSPAVRAFVLWTLRYGRLLWVVALIAAIPAAFRTASLYLHLRSEVEQLLPREAPSVRALDELRARSPGLHFLCVVSEVPDVADLPSAERFLDDLGDRVRGYPPEMVRNVSSNRSAERA